MLGKKLMAAVWADFRSRRGATIAQADAIDRWFEDKRRTPEERAAFLKAVERAGEAAEAAFFDALSTEGFRE